MERLITVDLTVRFSLAPFCSINNAFFAKQVTLLRSAKQSPTVQSVFSSLVMAFYWS